MLVICMADSCVQAGPCILMSDESKAVCSLGGQLCDIIQTEEV